MKVYVSFLDSNGNTVQVVERGGALVESKPFDRRVVGSNLTLA